MPAGFSAQPGANAAPPVRRPWSSRRLAGYCSKQNSRAFINVPHGLFDAFVQFDIVKFPPSARVPLKEFEVHVHPEQCVFV